MKEDTGQVSLEYLLIFSISIIIMIAFTMPLLEQSMKYTFDVSESLKAKSDLSEIAQAIMQVYGQGQGAKQTVKIDVDVPVTIKVTNTYISSKIKLKGGENKVIKINVKSKLKTDTLKLKKGIHTFVVEWPVDGKSMIIYQN